MKLLMIGSHLRTTGGITRVVKNYIDSGINKKTNFEYFPTYYGSNHFTNILFFLMQYIKLFFRLNILNEKFDVAHIHMSYKGSFIRKKYIINLFKKKNTPTILHMHGSEFKEFYNAGSVKRKKEIIDTLNSVNIILALGQEWKSYYESISKTHVISLDNAVFPKEFNNNFEEKIYITTMGVLSQRKGTYDLIEVAAKLKGKIDNKYKFILAGDGDIEKVKAKIRGLDLDHLFIVPGWISDQQKIDRIYQKSILYVLPSYNEGMPMSILEAMSYGLPVISTEVGSISSVVKPENGTIIKPGDINMLADSIYKLLNEPSTRNKMYTKNIEKINTDYNIFDSIDRLVSIYNELVLKSSN